MINNNLNATIRIDVVDINKKSLFTDFSASEKNEMIASLSYIGPDFQTFVLSFYRGFLGKDTLPFVKNESEESLINMLTVSLNLIITCIETPFPLADYIENIAQNYPNYPQLVKNTDLFAKSFMKALIGTFKDNYTERLGVLWYKAVSTFAVSVDSLLKKR